MAELNPKFQRCAMMCEMVQQNLPNVKTAESHANRGKVLEIMLANQHERYRFEHKAMIYHIPNAYRHCSYSQWKKLTPPLQATTGYGRTLQRIKSPFDFMGVALGHPVAFDAKEFKEASIPLDQFEDHQVEALCAYARAGGLGGFMIYAKRTNQVFYLDAFQVQIAKDKVRGKLGRGEHPKSFNVEMLALRGIFIGTFKLYDPVDWIPVLISEENQ